MSHTFSNRNHEQLSNSNSSPSAAAFAFHTSPEPPPMKKPRGVPGNHVKVSSSMNSATGYPRLNVPNNRLNMSSSRTGMNFQRPYQTQMQTRQNGVGGNGRTTPANSVVDKAISTRRAELQRLKERLRPTSATSTFSAKSNHNSRLVALAKTHLSEPLVAATRSVAGTKMSAKNKSVQIPTESQPPFKSGGTSTSVRIEPKKANENQQIIQQKQETNQFYINEEFEDPDYSMLVTPRPIHLHGNSNSPSIPPIKSTILHPRKLNLSSSTKPKPPPDKTTEVPPLTDEQDHEQNDKTKDFDDNKPLSTTSSQDTKETSHKQNPSPSSAPIPPPPTNIAPTIISTTNMNHSDISVLNISPSSLKDPAKAKAEKSLQDGTPIDTKRGLLYALGKYASDNQSINSISTRNHQITNFSAMSDMDVLETRSVSTRGSTSSQNTRRLVLQLREANEEKSAALRDVARLESELENRIRKESSPMPAGPSTDRKHMNDQKSSARSGALAMLICIIERRVEKGNIRYAWKKWKGDIFQDQEEQQMSPSRTREDSFDPIPYTASPTVYSSGGVKTPLNTNRLQSVPKSTNLTNIHEHNVASVITTPMSTSSSRRYRHILRSPLPSRPTNIASIPKGFLDQAYESVPKEFSSSMGQYIIRTPEVPLSSSLLSPSSSYLSKDIYSVMPQDVYDEVIDPGIPETLEIRANISVDESVLIVYGEMSIRHIKKDGKIIREVENVDDFGLLGYVPYIDCDGIENEYSLDEIYEEAIASRISYCDSLLSAALVLQKVVHSPSFNTVNTPPSSSTPTVSPKESENKPTIKLAPPTFHSMSQSLNGNNNGTMPNFGGSTLPPKINLSHEANIKAGIPPMNKRPPQLSQYNTIDQNSNGSTSLMNEKGSRMKEHASSGVKSISQPRIPPKQEIASANLSNTSKPDDALKVAPDKKDPKKIEQSQTSKKENFPQTTESSDSSQVLTSLLSFVLGSILSLLWFIFVTVPWRIISKSVYYIILTSISLMVWIYFAADNGADLMGSTIEECHSSVF